AVGWLAQAEARLRPESPVSPTGEKRDVVGIGIADSEIEETIPVEVFRDQRPGIGPRAEKLPVLKRSIPTAQQDSNVVQVRQDRGGRGCRPETDNQVEAAVPVEVAGDERARCLPYRKFDRRLERPVPPAQEQRHVAGYEIRGDEVEAAVAVEIVC